VKNVIHVRRFTAAPLQLAMKDPINHAYAEALLRVAQAEDALPRIEEDAFRLRELLKTSPALQEFIKNPNVRQEGKREALGQLLGNHVHPAFLDALLLIIGQNRGNRLDHILEEFQAAAAAAREHVAGEVISAVPLDDATVSRLEQELTKATNKNVHLLKRVEPSILGGLVVRLGHEVIDGSLRRRLEDIKQHLAG
jgi:F-type H+-transporting ATPase subunit delta